VEEATETLESDPSDAKNMVFVDGKMVNQLRGVLAMTLAEKICDGLGIKAEFAWGWQQSLRNMKDAIEERWRKTNA
jgi:hypothetical protein